MGALLWLFGVFGLVAGSQMLWDGHRLKGRNEIAAQAGVANAKIDDGDGFRRKGLHNPRFRFAVGVLLLLLGIAAIRYGVEHDWFRRRRYS
jgi:hypothetical protein